MNLAIVTPTISRADGQGRVNYEIVKEALRRGHRVILVAVRICEEIRDHPNVTSISIPVGRWPTDLLRNQVYAYRSAQWLKAHRAEIDVLHVNGFVTWELGDLNASHFVHGDWLRSPVRTSGAPRNLHSAYQWFVTVLNARWERRAYREARLIVAVSERVRKQLIRIGLPGDNIRVILNGVDLDEFTPEPIDRTDLGLPPDVPLALFVGDLRRSLKNPDTVLKALKQTPKVHLAMVGDAQGTPYPKMAEQLEIAERVHFLGFRRDVAQIMRAADLFVFPSRSESCPLVLFEALASGLPVILAPTVGASELVTSACGVILENPNDVQGLASAMQSMLQDPQRRACMGQAARKVAEQYSWQRMARAYFELYEELCTRPVD